MVTEYLRHVVKTKGILHALGRFAQIFIRFLSGKRLFKNMVSFLEHGSHHDGIRVTFCVSAFLLEKHRETIEKLKNAGQFIAAHGYTHSNMANKNKDVQIAILRKSYEAFEELDIPIYGFRCPYMSYNGDTLEALKSSAFSWTSNRTVFWGENIGNSVFSNNHLERLKMLYQFSYARHSLSLPKHVGQTIEIPVIIPDDEMLLDRYHIKDVQKMNEIWSRILERIYDHGELFHFLFHPERFDYIRDSIQYIVTKAREFDPPIWISSLDEIAAWWRERKKYTWHQERLNSDESIIWLRVPEGTTVLMKSEEGAQAGPSFYGNYAIAKPIARRNNEVAFLAGRSTKRSTIKISEECSEDVQDFLVEEGFLVECSKRLDADSFCVGGYEILEDKYKRPLLDAIDKSPFPLLRLWRWPKRAKAAFTISSDVDSICLMDFVRRAIYF